METSAELEEAVELYRRTVHGQALQATDPLERTESIASAGFVEGLAERELFEQVFLGGDEAFEAERDRQIGAGSGQLAPGLPARPRRVHIGELGGLDSSSCRSCHFAGGPDGSGTATQLALLRGDGNSLASTSVRDAPHVMGLGYVSLVARTLEAAIQDEAFRIQIGARADQVRVSTDLVVQGIHFGTLHADPPDGSLDTSDVVGISPDLRIRPFGHKGRHATLESLVDEALQIHHGHQSTSRIEAFQARRNEFLGNGPQFDPDDDGVVGELSDGQAVLLASYLSMLPIPRVIPPEDPELAIVAARGRRLFESTGCASCHRPSLRFRSYVTSIAGQGDSTLAVEIDLAEHGLEPKPVDVDFAPDPDGMFRAGVQLFLYSDLKRHDMGGGLADATDEELPDGADVIPASVWLTRSLWGLADTAPYLHDGRAPTVHDAILWHGGEAASSREGYMALSDRDQASLRVFLLSLRRDPVVLVE